MVAGKEVGDAGTPHLQCFVCYNARTRFSTIKQQLPTAHIERMMGTPQQASDYCKKDGDYLEFGTLPTDYQGGATGGNAKHARYKSAIGLAKSGDFDEIEDQHPDMYWNSYHTMKRISMDNPKPIGNLKKLNNEWIWGPTGTGKSHTAREENPGYYIKSHNKWWLGYKNEPCVIIDDISKTEAAWFGEHLKQWCDKYPIPTETKGDGKVIRPEKIVVTSNYTIEELWGHDEHLCQAITRRFKERHFAIPYIPDDDAIIADIVDQARKAYAEHSAHSEEDQGNDFIPDIQIID